MLRELLAVCLGSDHGQKRRDFIGMTGIGVSNGKNPKVAELFPFKNMSVPPGDVPRGATSQHQPGLEDGFSTIRCR